jgi:hypothetical protein
MADQPPHTWRAYARLQAELSRSHRISGRTWGLEEALNRIVWFESAVTDITAEEIGRAEATGGRRERSRASLRARYLQPAADASDPGALVEVLEVLDRIEAIAGAPGWGLLCAVAEGREYREIAADMRVTPGSLRARVLRLRRQCASAIAA